MTIGRLPCSDHCPAAFDGRVDRRSRARRLSPLEENGVPQQVPATSLGMYTGTPARRATSTVTSISERSCGSPGSRPIMREMQDGK